MSDFDRLESGSGFVEPLAGGTPDRIDSEPPSSPGVLVDVLPSNAGILITTRNSRYRLEVIDGADRRVRITGGKLFPEPLEVILEGAPTDAGTIKPGWICVGLPLALSTGLRRIGTSRVESVAFERVPSSICAA